MYSWVTSVWRSALSGVTTRDEEKLLSDDLPSGCRAHRVAEKGTKCRLKGPL